MNWQDKIFENLFEAELVGTTRGPAKGQVRKTYRRGSKKSLKRTTVSVSPISGKLIRRSWTAKKPSYPAIPDEEVTAPPMGKPGSDARQRYDDYKRNVLGSR